MQGSNSTREAGASKTAASDSSDEDSFGAQVQPEPESCDLGFVGFRVLGCLGFYGFRGSGFRV